MVTPDYFRVVGVQPMLGRAFTAADTVPGRPTSSFSATTTGSAASTAIPAILGKTIRMSRRDTPPTVVGVMPPGVRFLPSPRRLAGAELRRQRDGRFLDRRARRIRSG